MTEQQYLEQCNNNIKEKLLDTTSSDASDLSDDSQNSFVETNADTNAYSISDDDDSNDSLMNKFLNSKIKSEIQDSFVKSEPNANEIKVESENKSEIMTKKTIENEIPDTDGLEVHQNSESKNEEPEEEALNLEMIKPSAKSTSRKRSLEDEEDDAMSDKATTSKRDRMDSMIFSKNLFSNLDDFMEDKDDDIDSKSKDDDCASEKSIDSDCAILDVSMFKASKKSREISDARISKVLANAKKPSVPRASAPSECISVSSDSDLDLEEVTGTENDAEDVEESKSRVPRRMLRTDQLAGETKLAQREESERIKRLDSKNERLTQILSQSQSISDEEEVILDYDSKAKTNITVHPDIVKYLKKHQIDGVKFMYDTCYGSVDSIEKFPGSGCILAHCMGLGKTLQLIALLHTLIRYAQLKTNKILVICPKSTVMNWADEIQRWLGPVRSGPRIKVFHFPDSS